MNGKKMSKTNPQHLIRKSILVTGGAGFIGSNFIHYILNKEPNAFIINLDKLTYAGNLENLKGVAEKYKNNYKFIKGDICNKELVEHIFQEYKPDTLVKKCIEKFVKWYKTYFATNLK